MKALAASGPALLALLVVFFCGCRAREKPTPASSAGTNAPTRPAITAGGASSPAARRYPVRGVITSVDAAASRITVDHERIPGFMEAMTTPFSVRDDPRVIALLRPGDRIEATLVVEPGGFFLEQVLTKGFVPTPRVQKVR